jgi:hypothetical protein
LLKFNFKPPAISRLEHQSEFADYFYAESLQDFAVLKIIEIVALADVFQ